MIQAGSTLKKVKFFEIASKPPIFVMISSVVKGAGDHYLMEEQVS